MAAEHEEHAEHGVLTEFWEVFTDPAHILSEAASALVWDLLVFVLLLPLIKRYLSHRDHRIHREIDAEHGFEHADHAQARRESMRRHPAGSRRGERS